MQYVHDPCKAPQRTTRSLFTYTTATNDFNTGAGITRIEVQRTRRRRGGGEGGREKGGYFGRDLLHASTLGGGVASRVGEKYAWLSAAPQRQRAGKYAQAAEREGEKKLLLLSLGMTVSALMVGGGQRVSPLAELVLIAYRLARGRD